MSGISPRLMEYSVQIRYFITITYMTSEYLISSAHLLFLQLIVYPHSMEIWKSCINGALCNKATDRVTASNRASLMYKGHSRECSTMRSRYLAITFLQITHERDPYFPTNGLVSAKSDRRFTIVFFVLGVIMYHNTSKVCNIMNNTVIG